MTLIKSEIIFVLKSKTCIGVIAETRFESLWRVLPLKNIIIILQ